MIIAVASERIGMLFSDCAQINSNFFFTSLGIHMAEPCSPIRAYFSNCVWNSLAPFGLRFLVSFSSLTGSSHTSDRGTLESSSILVGVVGEVKPLSSNPY